MKRGLFTAFIGITVGVAVIWEHIKFIYLYGIISERMSILFGDGSLKFTIHKLVNSVECNRSENHLMHM